MKKLSAVFLLFLISASVLLSPAKASDASVAVPQEEVLVQEGIKALHENRAKDALKLFRQAKTTNPHFAPALVGEAEILTIQNAWDEALAILNRAIQISPQYGVAYHNRGVLYSYRGDYKKAYADLQRAKVLGETVETDLMQQVWGAAYPEEVVKMMTQQIADHPVDGEAYLNRGIAYSHQNNFQAALSDWKKAKELGTPIDEKMWRELELQMNLDKGVKNVAS